MAGPRSPERGPARFRGKQLAIRVFLTPEQVARLRALKAATRVPTAVRLREGIELALKAHEA